MIWPDGTSERLMSLFYLLLLPQVEWVDNQACVDVIESMPPKGLGVLAVLDSQCKFPKGSDETFMHALKESLSSNDHFGLDPRKQEEFFVGHYAGPVSYNVNGFLDKNKDMLNSGVPVGGGFGCGSKCSCVGCCWPTG